MMGRRKEYVVTEEVRLVQKPGPVNHAATLVNRQAQVLKQLLLIELTGRLSEGLTSPFP